MPEKEERQMINDRPVYLINSTNKKIARLFAAKKGTSLIRNKTIYSGICMNISIDGTISDTDGHLLFRLSCIRDIQYGADTITIQTRNNIYVFGF